MVDSKNNSQKDAEGERVGWGRKAGDMNKTLKEMYDSGKYERTKV